MRRMLVAVALVAVIGLAACSNAGSRTSTVARKGVASAAQPSAVPSHAAYAGGDRAEAVDLAKAKRDGRQIISTAAVTLEARDIDRTLRDATALARAAGGYLFSEDANLDDEHTVRAVFKVPPERFDNVVDGIAKLGKPVQRKVGTEDVTGQVVDLDARLAAARTSADRLRDLLSRSGNVGDLLSVEHELAAREGEVESLAGQLAAVKAQVDLATITLDARPLPVAPSPRPSHDIPGFVAGLRTGVAAFVNTMLVTGTALGFGLPFLGLAALVGLPARRVARRRRPRAEGSVATT